ncbi:hypothetical protein [uncultured Brevundimonas sp.]|uniref:hypothetical protein n=1 Tax=uncultured Brevundimonas sp. TaxID=213418 RepID=UPI0025D0E8B8|nr:hypothetical protein [uncultured Brevundimonas sp.]
MGALIAANFIASTTVGGMSLLAIWIGAVFSSVNDGLSSELDWAFILGLLAAVIGFVVSFPFYLVGLIVVGIPTWWVLHKVGRASEGVFMTTGVLASILVGGVVFRLFAPGSEVVAPLLAVPGVMVGQALWRYGYKPIKPPPAPPSAEQKP